MSTRAGADTELREQMLGRECDRYPCLRLRSSKRARFRKLSDWLRQFILNSLGIHRHLLQ
jgi:hypothetical protein